VNAERSAAFKSIAKETGWIYGKFTFFNKEYFMHETHVLNV
jgi:hypothetical protein